MITARWCRSDDHWHFSNTRTNITITGTNIAFMIRDYGEKLFQASKRMSGLRSTSILISTYDEIWQKFKLLPVLECPSSDKLPQRLILDLSDAKQVLRTVALHNSAHPLFRYFLSPS